VTVNRTAIYVAGSERTAVCVQVTADINDIAKRFVCFDCKCFVQNDILCVLTVSALYKTKFLPQYVTDPNTSLAILNVVIQIHSSLPHL
jgi:hypothetical protein